MGSANIYLRNDTNAEADLTLWHMSANFGAVGITGRNVAPGATIGPLRVQWNAATPADFWYASMAIAGGENQGMYVSAVPQDPLLPFWKECMLIGWQDDGTAPVFTVDTNSFGITLASGGCTADMRRIGDYSNVSHVFVLMLENRSFDHIFAFSGVPGITAATTANYNQYSYRDEDGTHTVTCHVSDSATPAAMPTDPGHEFADVVEQLSGSTTAYRPPTYPQIDMSGFLANYATSTSEKTGTPPRDQLCDIMACFQTSAQLPNINTLAHNYVLCDHWFASMPGPTWPNRFYVHGASSAYRTSADADTYQGLDDSPTSGETALWETLRGFTYRKGSIFDALDTAGIPWRIYHDDTLNTLGSIPQVAALKGISLANPMQIQSIGNLAGDLQSGYPYRYTFIEPNYGNILDNTYKGGSSQHPEDDVAGGENLIAQVFNAIARSPLWPNSVLIITYDEHGGFYDSVKPGGAVPPDTEDLPGTNGFVFNQLGVRVPAVVVSPLVAPGVDSTVYDHSSVVATITRLFGLQSLTARDAAANDLRHLFTQDPAAAAPPPGLVTGRTPAPQAALTPADATAGAAVPAPANGNLRGFLSIARKTDAELSARAQAGQAPPPVQDSTAETLGSSQAHVHQVLGGVRAARAQHEAAVRARVAAPGAKHGTSQR